MAEENEVVVVFVDDEPAIRRALVRLARRHLKGFTVLFPEDLVALREMTRAHPRAVVVFDGNCGRAFSGYEGWDLVIALRRMDWSGEALALTGAPEENAPLFTRAGIPAQRVFTKSDLGGEHPIWECLRALVQKGN